VVIAVLFHRLKDGTVAWIEVWIATKHARVRVNGLILYVCEPFPESNGSGLIREWAGWIVISIFVAIEARYIGLAFYDGVAGNRVQTNAVVRVSWNYLVHSICMRSVAVLGVNRQARVEGIIAPSCVTYAVVHGTAHVVILQEYVLLGR